MTFHNINTMKKDRGFTIVELLIVIVVIAILAAISVVLYQNVQKQGRDSERASDVSNVAKAISAYTTQDNAWPGSAAAASTALAGYDTVKVPQTVLNKLGTAASNTSAGVSTYGYVPCGTSPNFTGARISYAKEAKTETVTTVVGTCS